jgi:hypothetical protein
MLGCYIGVMLVAASLSDLCAGTVGADIATPVESPQPQAIPKPLPPGRPSRPPVYGILTEVTLRGTIQRFRRGHEGVWTELTTERDAGERTETYVALGDYSRTTAITGTRGVGFGIERFIGNDWSGELEVTTRWFWPRVSLRLNYFPEEGRVVGVGVDSRNGPTVHQTLWCDEDDFGWMLVVGYLYAREVLAVNELAGWWSMIAEPAAGERGMPK